jgi:hypothetical protein
VISVIGIDLSLRRTAAVHLPADWIPGTWDGVQSMVSEQEGVEGRDPEAHAYRLHAIAERLATFIGVCKVKHVYCEDHAYGLAGRGGVTLAELAGAVKGRLFARGVVVIPVNMMTARKLLLGKLPRKGAATAVQDALKQMGSPFEGSDEGDAWTVANWGRTELGMAGVTLG